MKITRRSFVKKSSYSAAAVTILGAGVALAENNSSKGDNDGEQEMQCVAPVNPITKNKKEFISKNPNKRYLLELAAESSTAKNDNWVKRDDFTITAGPARQNFNPDNAESGQGLPTAILYEQVKDSQGEWVDIKIIDPQTGLEVNDPNKQWHLAESGGSSNLFYMFERAVDGAGNISTEMIADNGPNDAPVHGPIDNGLATYKMELDAEISPDPITDSVTAKFTLTASNLPKLHVNDPANISLTVEVEITVTHVPEETP